MSKTVKKIIDYCIGQDIGTLVIGYNETFQRNMDIGRQNNQNFVNIPYGKLRCKLEYLCELNGIAFVKQEESYTFKASFWDNDVIPVYHADNPQSQFQRKTCEARIVQNCKWKTSECRCQWGIEYLKKK